jgi:hypothetical protein
VLPWLITTTGWPALTADVAGATAHVAAAPAALACGAVLAGALAGAALRWGRARGRPGGRST